MLSSFRLQTLQQFYFGFKKDAFFFILVGFLGSCNKQVETPPKAETSQKQGPTTNNIPTSQLGKTLKETGPQVSKTDPAPQPPSTGKEAQQPQEKPISLKESIDLINEAMDAFAKAKKQDEFAPCGPIAAKLKKGLWGGESPIPLNEKTEKAYAVLAICSAQNHQWLTALQRTKQLLEKNPQFPYAFIIPQALIHLGEFKEAEQSLVILIKKYPNNPEITYTSALFFSKIKDWENCIKFLDKTVNLLKALTPEQEKLLLNRPATLRIDALLLGVNAFYYSGKIEDSTKLINGLLVEYEAGIKQLKEQGRDVSWPTKIQNLLLTWQKRNELTSKTKMIVEPDLGNYEVYLSGYQFAVEQKTDVRPLLLLTVSNFDTQLREINYEVEIEGMTSKESPRGKADLLLQPGETKVFRITPPLLLTFAQNSLNTPTPVNLSIKVSSIAKDSPDKNLLYQDNIRLRVYPKNYLPLAQRIGQDVMVPTFGFMGPWITPQADEIDAFFQTAKKRAPNRILAGQQQSSFIQVKAIYEELQARGVSYVMDPGVLSDLHLVQKIRYPAEVLKSTNAQCLEGALLFATLFKALQLEATIVKIPGHAFVGWKANRYDLAEPKLKEFIAPDGFFYLETTMIQSASFVDAVKTGRKEVVTEQELGHFGKGIFSPSVFIDLKKLETLGFLNL